MRSSGLDRDGISSAPGILWNDTPFALTSPCPYICDTATNPKFPRSGEIPIQRSKSEKVISFFFRFCGPALEEPKKFVVLGETLGSENVVDVDLGSKTLDSEKRRGPAGPQDPYLQDPGSYNRSLTVYL